MSLHYIIDGYNVIKRVPEFSDKKLQSARESLISVLESARLRRIFRNNITVVFDGSSEVTPVKLSQSREVGVIFSSGENADSRIKRMVETSKNPKQIVVVTDDKEIIFYVRQCKSSVVSVQEFMNKIKIKPQRRVMRTTGEIKPGVDRHTAESINEELFEKWVGKSK